MDAWRSLEKSLDDIFVKRAPPLPAGGKKALIRYLPWINLVLGVLAFYTILLLWEWAHVTLKQASGLHAYGGRLVNGGGMTLGLWLGLVVLAMQGLLYLAAFPGTRDRKQAGWNLMFYALLVNIVYGIAILFTKYGNFGSLLSTIIGSAIGCYLLFQIRDSYTKTGHS